MTPVTHIDQARDGIYSELTGLKNQEPVVEKLLVIEDLFSRFRIVAWYREKPKKAFQKQTETALQSAGGVFFGGIVWVDSAIKNESIDRLAFDAAWNEGVAYDEKIRISVRYRRGNWLNPLIAAPWNKNGGAHIVSFYSVKGGVGRTTGLVSFALQCARAGQRVVVLDLDLDAPGIGSILTMDDPFAMAQYGVIDYLLEAPLFASLDLRDYYHVFSAPSVTQQGVIYVFSAGIQNDHYLGKLARVDVELLTHEGVHPLIRLLNQINDQLHPDWILLDSRAGLSEIAGLALSGIAHLNVLYGLSSKQSWQGLQQIIRRFGEERIQQSNPQIDCLLIQAMVPANPRVSELSTKEFSKYAEELFQQHYYAEDPTDPDEDDFWYIRDMEGTDSPHVTVPIHYSEIFAFYRSIEEIADRLVKEEDFVSLANRIWGRFRELDV